MVVVAMRAHPANVELQVNGCGTLRTVAEGDAACEQAVAAAGGLEMVVVAMRAHPADLRVQ